MVIFFFWISYFLKKCVSWQLAVVIQCCNPVFMQNGSLGDGTAETTSGSYYYLQETTIIF